MSDLQRTLDPCGFIHIFLIITSRFSLGKSASMVVSPFYLLSKVSSDKKCEVWSGQRARNSIFYVST